MKYLWWNPYKHGAVGNPVHLEPMENLWPHQKKNWLFWEVQFFNQFWIWTLKNHGAKTRRLYGIVWGQWHTKAPFGRDPCRFQQGRGFVGPKQIFKLHDLDPFRRKGLKLITIQMEVRNTYIYKFCIYGAGNFWKFRWKMIENCKFN